MEMEITQVELHVGLYFQIGITIMEEQFGGKTGKNSQGSKMFRNDLP